jgi:hypothetical protein
MQGFEAITFGDEHAGTVVGREGQFLIVEQGTIFKHRRPVPETFATVDESAGVVRLTVSKHILESAPEAKPGVDEVAAAEHYGLADGFAAPETEGYGVLDADDPAFSADRDAADQGLETAAERRAAALGRLGAGLGANDAGPPSPGVTGGDRRRDATDN